MLAFREHRLSTPQMETNSSSPAFLNINHPFFFFQLIADHASRDVTVQEIKCLWATSVFLKRNALKVGLQNLITTAQHIRSSHPTSACITWPFEQWRILPTWRHIITGRENRSVVANQKENPLTKTWAMQNEHAI